ncbi:hypothetical protein LJC48_02125 [Desulfovibrio sp. OttesenSCG-928-C06]|nr:hypothetical protein [Desulfovibrio sp. OttesenSCG-928-C06]
MERKITHQRLLYCEQQYTETCAIIKAYIPVQRASGQQQAITLWQLLTPLIAA